MSHCLTVSNSRVYSKTTLIGGLFNQVSDSGPHAPLVFFLKEKKCTSVRVNLTFACIFKLLPQSKTENFHSQSVGRLFLPSDPRACVLPKYSRPSVARTLMARLQRLF